METCPDTLADQVRKWRVHAAPNYDNRPSDTVYDFRAQAINSAGAGPFCQSLRCSTLGPPQMPSQLVQTSSTASTFSFLVPAQQRAPITHTFVSGLTSGNYRRMISRFSRFIVYKPMVSSQIRFMQLGCLCRTRMHGAQ